jgi:hypothetical protein
VLQLLFDLRFARNALRGGRPPEDGADAAGARSGSGATAAALAARKRAFAATEAALQARCPCSASPCITRHSVACYCSAPGPAS